MLPPDHLAQRIVSFLQERAPQALGAAGDELNVHVQMLLRETFSRLELVSREEFAVQEKVLARTRARLEALEKQVAQLEAAMTPPGNMS